MTWLDDLMKATEESESPRQFIYWAGLTAISAVLRKRVWMRRKNVYMMYPNLYVIIVAKAGGRKQFPVDVLRSLLWEVKSTRVISGQNTIEGIIGNLRLARTTEENKVVETDAQACMVSSEFSNLLKGDASEALTVFTQWYDTHSIECREWRKTLKAEEYVLKNICVSLFGATNAEHFNRKLTEADIKGGFIGRCLLVESNKRAKLDPLVDDDEDLPLIDWAKLAERLKEIEQINGQFRLDTQAKNHFKEWYFEFNKGLENAEWVDLTGFAERVHDHILKTTICLTVDESNELTGQLKHLEKAMELVLPLLDRARELLRGKGKSDTGEQTALVLQSILDRPDYRVTRENILRRHWNDLDSTSLDICVRTLVGGGYIEEKMVDNKVVYELTDRCKVEYDKIRKREIN